MRNGNALVPDNMAAVPALPFKIIKNRERSLAQKAGADIKKTNEH